MPEQRTSDPKTTAWTEEERAEMAEQRERDNANAFERDAHGQPIRVKLRPAEAQHFVVSGRCTQCGKLVGYESNPESVSPESKCSPEAKFPRTGDAQPTLVTEGQRCASCGVILSGAWYVHYGEMFCSVQCDEKWAREVVKKTPRSETARRSDDRHGPGEGDGHPGASGIVPPRVHQEARPHFQVGLDVVNHHLSVSGRVTRKGDQVKIWTPDSDGGTSATYLNAGECAELARAFDAMCLALGGNPVRPTARVQWKPEHIPEPGYDGEIAWARVVLDDGRTGTLLRVEHEDGVLVNVDGATYPKWDGEWISAKHVVFVEPLGNEHGAPRRERAPDLGTSSDQPRPDWEATEIDVLRAQADEALHLMNATRAILGCDEPMSNIVADAECVRQLAINYRGALSRMVEATDERVMAVRREEARGVLAGQEYDPADCAYEGKETTNAGSTVQEGPEGGEAVQRDGRRDDHAQEDREVEGQQGAVRGGRTPLVRREDGARDRPGDAGDLVAPDRDGWGVAVDSSGSESSDKRGPEPTIDVVTTLTWLHDIAHNGVRDVTMKQRDAARTLVDYLEGRR